MSSDAGIGVDEGTRTMLLLMPRLVGRAKRMPPPEALRSLDLAPRHLSLLAYLVFDGPLAVNDLAARLEVAPTTVSLMVGDLSRKGLLERREDDADRRRTIVHIADEHRRAVEDWLAVSARAWRTVLEPLTPEQRRLVVDTLRAYEEAAAQDGEG
ncbi:DNA-binding MarR family transcriptional regulator [Lipingzhangella halophila]|uniref:DNA-binding MarR family transcriptional regulator n=1 Tax=Lipingzhangella halophila TaxID=1783352 RepID=A0A7W7RK22_9ACTN|nr:MarR family winged helix-turn-helix transcriptional regulator [Lipingzhangella halophila]MBB4932993.1 DNA-binding MarR family transcriptional regulator [Lipingzhangella halophila]